MFSSSTTNFTLIGARRRPLRCQKLTIRSNCEFSLVHTDISLPIRQKFACERVDLWCAFAYAEFHFDASCYPEGREIPKLNNEPSSIQCSQKVKVFKKSDSLMAIPLSYTLPFKSVTDAQITQTKKDTTNFFTPARCADERSHSRIY